MTNYKTGQIVRLKFVQWSMDEDEEHLDWPQPTIAIIRGIVLDDWPISLTAIDWPQGELAQEMAVLPGPQNWGVREENIAPITEDDDDLILQMVAYYKLIGEPLLLGRKEDDDAKEAA